jgi:D-sedoheptulose 7-phosphate isomerase
MAHPDFQVTSRDVHGYFTTVCSYLTGTAVTFGSGQACELSYAVNHLIAEARRTHAAGNKLIFIGNGGSASIASHMATDYVKNGGVRAVALNDSSMLTCVGNDLGYDQVFAKQIEWYARPGDLVVAISSSGRSPNILNAVKAARVADCTVVTLSGFTRDNPLRSLGDINFYIASDRYGFVEIAHLTICHAILDFICDLRVSDVISPAVDSTGESDARLAELARITAAAHD